MAKNRLNTQFIGLDVGLSFTKWLTGAENLHYGLWTGLEINAANLRPAQDAYTDKLFGLLPEGKLKILDIGGGAGETAAKLIALGHAVDIIVPSPFLAARCRENAPQAQVHECMFEDFQNDRRFDLCLFSESFQYIPAKIALEKSMALLAKGGTILLADCFRSENYTPHEIDARPGGGHKLADFRKTLAEMPLKIISEEDITDQVAPSIDLEQGLFNVFGHAISRVDQELAEKRRGLRWGIHKMLALFISKPRRARLNQRLNEKQRNAANFKFYNRYLMMMLRPTQ